MIYRLVLSLRHLFYDKGWKKICKAPVPTICIDNRSAGDEPLQMVRKFPMVTVAEDI